MHGRNTGHSSSGSSTGSESGGSSNICRFSFFMTPVIRRESSSVNGQPAAGDHINPRRHSGPTPQDPLLVCLWGRQDARMGAFGQEPRDTAVSPGPAPRLRRDPAPGEPTREVTGYSPFWVSGSGSPEAPHGFFFTLPVILESSSTNAGTGVSWHIILQACGYPKTRAGQIRRSRRPRSVGIES